MEKYTSADHAKAILVIIAITLAYFWSDITKSNIYMRTFKHDEWVLKEEKAAAFRVKWKALDKDECRILMQARRDVIPIEIDRNILLGMDKETAEKFASLDVEEDQKMCDKFGISPYQKAEQPKSNQTCFDRQGSYDC